MRLSEVLGMDVVGPSGRSRGRVVDLRSMGEAERGEAHTARVITEIIVARMGWLQRMGIRPIREEVIPWSEVATVGIRRVTLVKD